MDRISKLLGIGTRVFACVGLAGVIAYALAFAYTQAYFSYFGVGLDEAGVSRLSLISPFALMILVVLLPVLVLLVLGAAGASVSSWLHPMKGWMVAALLLWLLILPVGFVRNGATEALAPSAGALCVVAVAAMAWGAHRLDRSPEVANEPASERSKRPYGPIVFLAIVAVVAMLTVVLDLLHGAGWADAHDAAHDKQHKTLLLEAVMLPNQGQPVNVDWLAAVPRQQGGAFLYLGQSNGVTVLWDYTHKMVLRVPSADLAIYSSSGP